MRERLYLLHFRIIKTSEVAYFTIFEILMIPRSVN